MCVCVYIFIYIYRGRNYNQVGSVILPVKAASADSTGRIVDPTRIFFNVFIYIYIYTIYIYIYIYI